MTHLTARLAWLLVSLYLFARGLSAQPVVSLELQQNQLVVHAAEGVPVAIESSDDLMSWQRLVEGVAEHGEFRFAISIAGSQFFRARAEAVRVRGLVTTGQGAWIGYNLGGGPLCARIALVAQKDAKALHLHFAGWVNTNGIPVTFPGKQPIKAAWERADSSGNPSGQITPITFGNERIGYLIGGSELESDDSINVTAGEKLFLRVYQMQNDSDYYIRTRFLTGQAGEVFGLGDLTDSASGWRDESRSLAMAVLMPGMISGMVQSGDRLGVVLLGDSVLRGQCDSYVPDVGYAGRALAAAGMPYVNVAVGGSTAHNWALTNLSQAGYLPMRFANSVMINLGLNDLNGGDSAVNMTNYLGQIASLCRSTGIRRVVGTAIKPRTFSTNGYQTLQDQTVTSWDPARLALNAWVRTNTVMDAYFDLDAALRDPTQPSKNATGPAVLLYSGVTGEQSKPYAARTQAADASWLGATIVVNGESAAIDAVGQGMFAWIGFIYPITSLTSGDDFTIVTSWTGDGAHPNGLGNAAAAATMDVNTLFP